MPVNLPPASAVLTLVSPTRLTEGEIDVIIADAALMVETCVKSLDDARQAAIIKYVTAHMIAISGRGGRGGVLTSKKLGDASETYARGTVGAGLSSSTFGQQALALDPSGCLFNLTMTSSIVFEVL